MSVNINDPSIPNVGGMLEAFEADIQCVIRCKCDPFNVPMLVSSITQARICGRCKTVYGIMICEYNRNAGQQRPKVLVAAVGKQQSEEKTKEN